MIYIIVAMGHGWTWPIYGWFIHRLNILANIFKHRDFPLLYMFVGLLSLLVISSYFWEYLLPRASFTHSGNFTFSSTASFANSGSWGCAWWGSRGHFCSPTMWCETQEESAGSLTLFIFHNVWKLFFFWSWGRLMIWAERRDKLCKGWVPTKRKSNETLGTAEKWMIKQNEGVEICLNFWPISSNIYPKIIAGHLTKICVMNFQIKFGENDSTPHLPSQP